MYSENVTDKTPIAMLTVGQLREVLDTCSPKSESVPQVQSNDKRYVYGLRGIRNLFKVSHTTAQMYKHTILKGACIQNGRKIIIDVDKALELFAQHNDVK